MPLLHDEMRRSYAAQRGVSQGAGVTLVATSGGYEARFDCATRAARILGDRSLRDYEGIPLLLIPTDDAHRGITKLSEAFSVALVDTMTDENGTRFVLVWKIHPRTPEEAGASEEVLTDPNQGNLNLDEY